MKLSPCPCSHSSPAGQIAHACLCWHLKCNLLLAQAGPRMMQHLSNFTEEKSREVCEVLLDKGLFLKNRMRFATKRSVWPSSMLKTVDLSIWRIVRHFPLLGWSDYGSKFDRVCIT